MVFRRDRQMTIALTYGPDSQWVHNVIANGGCDLQTEGRKLRLVQPHLIHDERRTRMPAFVRLVLGLLNVSDFLELSLGAQ
jgi:hypothetical protein